MFPALKSSMTQETNLLQLRQTVMTAQWKNKEITNDKKIDSALYTY